MRAVNFAFTSSGNTMNPFADTASATKTGSGSKATLYGSINYRFNRATMIYVAADYMKLYDAYKVAGAVSGTIAGGTALDNQTEIVAGTRLLF
jgi:predicted porin